MNHLQAFRLAIKLTHLEYTSFALHGTIERTYSNSRPYGAPLNQLIGLLGS